MPKLSIIIPSRDERFLTPTIDDIFRNARSDDTEVIAVLDSDKWPGDWKEVAARHPRLHTIHNGRSIGMRGSINKGVASAISRGAKFVMKLDGHCGLGEGFDEILKAECDEDWVVVPRRLRLEPESWTIAESEKPPHDYHYLSFPDDPNDFGGPGLNGKPWFERQKERAEILLDEEMSSQGSCWFMYADYFTKLELMNEEAYGPFWSEFQEVGLNCWLSSGRVIVNKKTHYAHLHKGRKYGRGYRLPESALVQGRNQTMKWIWNEAWGRQTLPFKWLIEHFWPVPSWPENWEEVLYAERKPRAVGPTIPLIIDTPRFDEFMRQNPEVDILGGIKQGLRIHFAYYGADVAHEAHRVDVAERVRGLVKNDSLDIIVNNSTLTPDHNPFRGKKKQLWVNYSYSDGEPEGIIRDEKDWLIIGQAQRNIGQQAGEALQQFAAVVETASPEVRAYIDNPNTYPMTAVALNDYLIRKFSISPQRLRGPMPIELRDFHRDDLAQLFAELGFKRGAEIGVAEGKYSEVLLKANPQLEKLYLIDPWHHYSNNPQGKSKERHEFAFDETKRRVAGSCAEMVPRLSMEAVTGFKDGELDFVYLDGNHSYPYVMCDIIEWSKRVRSGGIVALDDVYKLDEARWGAGPMEAIYDYTRAMRINPWWLIDAHKSVDAFFVKL